MTYPSLAIIGTAGRKDDQTKLTHESYSRMVSACTSFLTHVNIDHNTVKVYSGGAAWADHLVVTLALLGVFPYENITLFLPCELSSTGYVGDTARSNQTAGTCNYYHAVFSKVTGHDSLKELHWIKERGANLLPGKGSFHARNTDVARSVGSDGALLAFTFGSLDSNQPDWSIKRCGNSNADDSGLKDGGTADTWNKANCDKFHCKLSLM